METICAQLSEVLDHLDLLLHGLPGEVYRMERRGHSSVGRHLRHVVDHFEALRSAPAGGVIYSARTRGSRLETEVGAALEALQEVRGWLQHWTEAQDVPVRVIDIVGPRQQEQFVASGSSFRRELMWVASHTVHHLATMNALIAALGQSTALAAGDCAAPATRLYETDRGLLEHRPLKGRMCVP